MISAIALGFRAQRGGSVVVGVTLDGNEPRAVLSTFLSTAIEGDRLSIEPYHVAAEMERGPDGRASAAAAAAVARGRERQDQLATAGLEAIVRTVHGEGPTVIAALLTNRAGWISDLLDYSIAFADHPPVAEGLAVRDALRCACSRVGVDVMEIDEKSLNHVAAEKLGHTSSALDARLTMLGATVGRPWRKEQKHACLAAWVALATLHHQH